MKKIKSNLVSLIGRTFACLQCHTELAIESEIDYHIYYDKPLQFIAKCPTCDYENHFKATTGELLK